MDDNVKALLTLYVPIIVFGYLLLFLDWLSRRQERKADKQKPA